jgi:hypothetical protein
MDAYIGKSHHDYEKKVFVHVALCMAILSIFVGFNFGLQKGCSVLLGFVVVYVCYYLASGSLIVKDVLNNTSELNKQFGRLIKASLVRLFWAVVFIGGVLWLKKRIPSIPVDSVYLVLGFIISVIVYRIRVVLGEVRNV